MVSEKILVGSALGIHLRPAGAMCDTAVKFDSHIVEDERNFFVEIRNYPHRLLSKKESVQSVVKSNIRIINLSVISCWYFYNILHGHLPAPPKNCCIAFCLF